MAKKYSCEVKPYRLEFKEPAITSRDTMLHRDIWTMRIADNFGRDGFGEVAPIAGLSKEFDSNFEDKLNEVASNIEYYLQNKPELIAYPSILFGLESAWLSYKHRNFVFFDTPFTSSHAPIPINALVWMGHIDQMKHRAQEILTKSPSCIKIKIGSHDFNQELELIQSIRSQCPSDKLEIRLDANGAFSVSDALDKIKILSELEIHSIEQPIRAGQLEEMESLIQESPIPVALDEELIGISDYKQKFNLIERLKPNYIVIKPSLHGGLLGAEEWIFIANTLKSKWWVTSALESNIGLNVIAQWCSRYDTCYHFPQGLGTGELYINNFPTYLDLENYELRLKS